MVILHNAIKTIQNVFFLKNKNLLLFKKPEFEKTGELEFFEEYGFFSTLTIFQSFFVIFPRSGTTDVTISLIGHAPCE